MKRLALTVTLTIALTACRPAPPPSPTQLGPACTVTQAPGAPPLTTCVTP